MKKVLLIQNTISNYRVPVYNLLAEKYYLDAICSYGSIPEDAKFKITTISTHNLWKFTVHNKSLYKIAQNYDVVLGLFSPTWVSISSLLLRAGRKYKFIPWGIGVPASYSVHYDDTRKSTKLTEWMIKKSDAVLFYSDYPVRKYSNMGYDKRKMFVAHNTVKVLPADNYLMRERNSILFIGTLYKSKGIMTLLESYKKVVERGIQNPPYLRIVGGGDEYDSIKDWIYQNNLTDLIKLEGAIYDEKVIRDYFSEAIACISPGQAGLSVQKSMGYGVPFVTNENAYTGGERLDIEDGYNGVLYKDESELLDVLVDICTEKEKYTAMGKKAYEFYKKNRTIEMMANGASQAIEFALQK